MERKSRRKKKVAAVCLLVAGMLKEDSKRKRACWTHEWVGRRNFHGAHHALLKELAIEDPRKFRNFLRMNEDTFQELLRKVGPIISKRTTNMREPISASERLSLTPRFLASGNTYQDLEYLFRIPVCTSSLIIPETCEAIYEVLKEEFLKMPASEDEWNAIEQGFSTRWNFPNCFGAIDGKHVVITPPPSSGSAYYNYKNTFSIVLLALVDADYKFSYIDVGNYGRIGDSGVYHHSTLSNAMEKGSLRLPPPKPLPGREKPVPFTMVADEAFPLKPNIMKPYPGRALAGNKERRIYNYRLSRARRIVENAFGILANRFAIFKKPIPLSPDKVVKIVLASCSLQNFLRSKSGGLYTPPGMIDHEEDGVLISGSWRWTKHQQV